MVYQAIFKNEEVIYLSILQKIDNEKNLEKDAVGYEAIFGATNTLKVSKDGYEKLEKEGYIVDGKIKHRDVIKAVNFLSKEGFEGKIESLCFMYLGYEAPEYAELIIIDDNANK